MEKTQDMNNRIDKHIARRVIETVGSFGTPPEWGFQYFTVGLDDYLHLIDDDYLKTFIKEDGGSTFKLVIGAYGGGKTHFLYNIRELAWQENFVVSYVNLSSEEAPFYRLELVYRAIVNNLMYPMTPEELLKGQEKGVEAFIATWYERQAEIFRQAGLQAETLDREIEDYARSVQHNIENVNFSRAVANAFLSLHREREEDFRNIIQWLRLEGYERNVHKEYGLLHPIERSNAFSMIRSLIQWVRNIGYAGLVILFDEAEQVPSLSSKQRELMLSNLREIIDECGHASFKNVMIFYALPDENIFEGASNVYEALKQRVSSIFDFYNPSGVKIRLEGMEREPIAFLEEVGTRLRAIYEQAYEIAFPDDIAPVIQGLAHEAYERRFGDIGYVRLFVQGIIRAFHILRKEPTGTFSREQTIKLLEG
ncbi:MAG: BREX system ATP-binding domain-containing protein [bacterium]